MSDFFRPQGQYSPWNSPGQNTGVGSLSLLQGIFPTQGSNPGHPHCRRILYQLSYKGSPTSLQTGFPDCLLTLITSQWQSARSLSSSPDHVSLTFPTPKAPMARRVNTESPQPPTGPSTLCPRATCETHLAPRINLPLLFVLSYLQHT